MERRLQKRLHILLVDDDEDEFILTRDLLTDRSYLSNDTEQVGFELDWVGTYEAALDSFRNRRHDIYLVDYQLGIHDGLELLREAIGLGCKSPIIILTGQGNYDVDIAAMRAGAADYLVKGQIDPQLLERSIRYAVERTQLLNALNERATRDDLTGLYNRREMNYRLDEEITRSKRFGHPLSLVLMDVDHFKHVNDAYGHQVGDEVLRRVAKLLIITVRSIDQAARYGGDEFMIVFPETSTDQAAQVAERLRLLISAQPFYILQDNGRQLRIPLSSSIGIASLPDDAKNRDQLIELADRALYNAKKHGRNCVIPYKSIRSKQ
ncbi:MAG: diguanylate cyclase [Chloroflexota bacterium]|nr:MAG: diguanylate cyclase [Chloroflexota bacterium]